MDSSNLQPVVHQYAIILIRNLEIIFFLLKVNQKDIYVSLNYILVSGLSSNFFKKFWVRGFGLGAAKLNSETTKTKIGQRSKIMSYFD